MSASVLTEEPFEQKTHPDNDQGEEAQAHGQPHSVCSF